jgi:hypothetical protein
MAQEVPAAVAGRLAAQAEPEEPGQQGQQGQQGQPQEDGPNLNLVLTRIQTQTWASATASTPLRLWSFVPTLR